MSCLKALEPMSQQDATSVVTDRSQLTALSDEQSRVSDGKPTTYEVEDEEIPHLCEAHGGFSGST